MSARFVNVMRQAFKTFGGACEAPPQQLATLKQLTEQLTFQDFHLSQQDLLSDEAFERDRAPCAYVHIFENELVSMGIFVLRGGYTMPLHDHPMMHGILRGIFGRLKVQSYTQQYRNDETPSYDRTAREIQVKAEPSRIVGPDTESAILTPQERNFHEISAVGGVAAFFDILSPPYDAEIPIYGSRRCRFYRVEENIDQQNGVAGLTLIRIPAPRWYYCDTIETPEAVLKSTFICSAEAYSSTA